MNIVFVTHAGHPEIEEDDRPLAAALARRGALVHSASRDDAAFAWDRTDMVLLRSPWDYYLRFDEFLEWLTAVDPLTSLVNSAAIVRWNANKRYMSELVAKGVHTVPTTFIAQEEVASLDLLCTERGWGAVVPKPAVFRGFVGDDPRRARPSI